MLESNKHVLGKYILFGGCDGTERNIARFGNSEELGYEEDFPIVCLEILPKSEKFAEPLCHRDFLGALMNLGIERKNIGDISVMHKRAEHLTVLTDIFSPDTAADGLEICPILPSPSFLSRQKSVPLKLHAPKTDYFCPRFVEDDAGIPGVFQGGRNTISAKRTVFGVRVQFSYA